MPVTFAGYEKSKADGYYEKQPGADIRDHAARARQHDREFAWSAAWPTGEIRVILYEETEKALQGQQSGKQALDNGVSRGNRVLREFQKSVGG